MNNPLSHLPEDVQAEIRYIVDIIKEVVSPEAIILYGSHARGKQVNDKYLEKSGLILGYTSDYDFLVVTKDDPKDFHKWESEIMNRTDKCKNPVSLEIHGIDYINKGLELGEYFFTEIIKYGIVLCETGKVHFADPRELTPLEERERAQRYFDTWFPQVEEFIEGSRFHLGRGHSKIGVFVLHQAAESLYYSILLVFTAYKPKTHNLWKLRKRTIRYSKELFLVFCTETDKKDKYLFDLLKRGYIDARYRNDYKITSEELTILIEKVTNMASIVEKVCKDKICSFN
jgi:HEPN domain-containing protein